MGGDLFQEIGLLMDPGIKVGNYETEIEEPFRWPVWCSEGEMFSIEFLDFDDISIETYDE